MTNELIDTEAVVKEEWEFIKFLKEIEIADFPTNTTATGTITIQQSLRNELRKKGVAALKSDLQKIYGDQFDILETKEGIVIAAENEPGDFTFSWELKNTIKSIDYDPFIEANNYDIAVAEKQAHKLKVEEEKATRAANIQAKREAKLAELERKKNLIND